MEPINYLDVTTRITKDGIYFGDEKIPGLIASDGITLHPGGRDDINRLTVTFLVGPVEATDPMVVTSWAGDSMVVSSPLLAGSPMTTSDPATCEHDYELDKAEQTERGVPNVAHLVCRLCGHGLARRTLKSVATIKAEVAEASNA